MRKILWASLFAWIVLALASCNPGPPKVIQTVAPIYPGITRIMRIEGSIVISVGLTFEFRIAGEAGSEQKVTFLPPYRMMITAPFPEIQTNNSKTNRVATS